MSIDTSKEHLAAVLGRLLEHLEDQRLSAATDAFRAGERRLWAAGQLAETWEKALVHVQREIAGLLTWECQTQKPTRQAVLIADLRAAAGLAPGQDWPE